MVRGLFAFVLAAFFFAGTKAQFGQRCKLGVENDCWGDGSFCCESPACCAKAWIDGNLGWFITFIVIGLFLTCGLPLLCCCLCPFCILAQRRQRRGRVIASAPPAGGAYAFSTVQPAHGSEPQTWYAPGTEHHSQPPTYYPSDDNVPANASQPRHMEDALPPKY